MEDKVRDYAWTVVQLAQLAKRLEAQWKELGWGESHSEGYYNMTVWRLGQAAVDMLDLVTHKLDIAGHPAQEPGVPDEEYVRTLLGKPEHFAWEDYLGWVEVMTGIGDWKAEIAKIAEECRRNADYFERLLKVFTSHRAGWDKVQELLHHD